MVVTRVGGLPEIVPDGKVGFVCEPTVEGVRKAIEQLYEKGALQRLAENFPEERKRFSWETMCDKLIEVYNQTK
jgi:glycosyltransferase involved in cell wall biosynthesis